MVLPKREISHWTLQNGKTCFKLLRKPQVREGNCTSGLHEKSFAPGRGRRPKESLRTDVWKWFLSCKWQRGLEFCQLCHKAVNHRFLVCAAVSGHFSAAVSAPAYAALFLARLMKVINTSSNISPGFPLFYHLPLAAFSLILYKFKTEKKKRRNKLQGNLVCSLVFVC